MNSGEEDDPAEGNSEEDADKNSVTVEEEEEDFLSYSDEVNEFEEDYADYNEEFDVSDLFLDQPAEEGESSMADFWTGDEEEESKTGASEHGRKEEEEFSEYPSGKDALPKQPARFPKDTEDEDDDEFHSLERLSSSSIHRLETYGEDEDLKISDESAYPVPDFPDFAIVSLHDETDERVLTVVDLRAPDDESHFDNSALYAECDAPDSQLVKEKEKADHIAVKIEPPLCRKPFLGGFVRTSTGVEYHNASCQASLRPVSDHGPTGGTGGDRQRCCETQTKELEHLRMQTTNDVSTQMTGVGFYVPNLSDRLLIPGRYETSEERERRQLQQIITIQKYYRRWMSKVAIERSVARKRYFDDLRNASDENAEEEKQRRLRRDYERRSNPRTIEDFDLLFTYLEKWRRKEVDRINATLESYHRKAALCDLMDRQAQLIHCIGLKRLEIADELNLAFVNSFLNKVAAPITRGTKGKQVLIEDDNILQAQELRDVFASLNLKYLTSEERMDLLITVKSILQLHPCSISAELEKLIDRERELLSRGFGGRGLDGLRKRIGHLFLQYIRLPKVNPAASRFAKVPSDPKQLCGKMHFCSSCHRYLTPNDFRLSTNLRKLGRCQDCTRIDNRARKRKDFSIYRLMLKNLWRSEDLFNDNAKTAYLMQEKDLRYLIVYIWHSRSIISAHDDLFDLEFLRWNQCEEWSPWNCVLLTKGEAKIHGKVGKLEKAYSKDFLHEVHCRHLVAKKYFSRLLKMARLMPNTSTAETTAVRRIAKQYLTTAATEAQ